LLAADGALILVVIPSRFRRLYITTATIAPMSTLNSAANPRPRPREFTGVESLEEGSVTDAETKIIMLRQTKLLVLYLFMDFCEHVRHLSQFYQFVKLARVNQIHVELHNLFRGFTLGTKFRQQTNRNAAHP